MQSKCQFFLQCNIIDLCLSSSVRPLSLRQRTLAMRSGRAEDALHTGLAGVINVLCRNLTRTLLTTKTLIQLCVILGSDWHMCSIQILPNLYTSSSFKNKNKYCTQRNICKQNNSVDCPYIRETLMSTRHPWDIDMGHKFQRGFSKGHTLHLHHH